MLSESERVYLDWFNRMVKRAKYLDAAQELGFRRWLAKGGKRTEWPGWEILIGLKPMVPGAKKANQSQISEVRKRA